ncbi:MAG TPA: transferrin-binding protein-like solute binding protein [Sphingomonas sp.]
MAAFLLLGGCGGGGGGGIGVTPAPPSSGGGGSGGTPAPTPTPMAVNTLISDLQANQTFTSDATSTQAVLRTANGVVDSTGQTRSAVQVSYDAATRSYTVATDGRSQTFAPAERRADRISGEASFAKLGSTNDYLTLVTTPYYGSGTANRYVGLGYWQRNSTANGVQNTLFTTFAYGLATVSGVVPRTGSAHWTTDIFGLLTTPGQELRTVQGRGDFDIDFAGAVFTGFANLDEFDFITGGGRVGSLRFRAGGQLGSGNGFSGNMSYASGRVGTLGGTISGQFYGPGAEEIGASFQASGGGTGSVLNGALTGQRTTSVGSAANLSLVNVQSTERLFGTYSGTFVQAREGQTGFSQVNALTGDAQVTIAPTGPGAVSLDNGAYTPVDGDRVADGRANYIIYRGQAAGTTPGPVEVAFYRPGSANSEIALTYLSFATWTRTTPDMANGQRISNTTRRHILYGITTPRELLVGRTGTGSYDGIVVASGASRNGTTYDVGGTSHFDVDFSSARYTGALALSGTASDGTRRDFGNFAFGSTINEGVMVQSSFDGGRNADPFNTISPAFYGPDGQEIGATFRMTVGNPLDAASVAIGGITVAKRR